jgi:hypothetical protein
MMGALQWAHSACGQLIDPHSAIGLAAARRAEAEIAGPIDTLATAHPAKFPDAVERASGVRAGLPRRVAHLFDRAERYDRLPADAQALVDLLDFGIENARAQAARADAEGDPLSKLRGARYAQRASRLEAARSTFLSLPRDGFFVFRHGLDAYGLLLFTSPHATAPMAVAWWPIHCKLSMLHTRHLMRFNVLPSIKDWCNLYCVFVTNRVNIVWKGYNRSFIIFWNGSLTTIVNTCFRSLQTCVYQVTRLIRGVIDDEGLGTCWTNDTCWTYRTLGTGYYTA